MTDYSLEWSQAALKAWRKLDPQTQAQFEAKLRLRLHTPRVPGDKLSGLKDCYKIKLRSVGYRLVYQVIEGRLVILVVSVGRRDDASVYKPKLD